MIKPEQLAAGVLVHPTARKDQILAEDAFLFPKPIDTVNSYATRLEGYYPHDYHHALIRAFGVTRTIARVGNICYVCPGINLDPKVYDVFQPESIKARQQPYELQKEYARYIIRTFNTAAYYLQLYLDSGLSGVGNLLREKSQALNIVDRCLVSSRDYYGVSEKIVQLFETTGISKRAAFYFDVVIENEYHLATSSLRG